jgi:hypothetical protein
VINKTMALDLGERGEPWGPGSPISPSLGCSLACLPPGRWLPLIGLVGLLAGCGHGEKPLSTAKPGDTLVVVGPERLELVQPFQPGEPNGLYHGIVRLQGGTNGKPQLYEVSAVCSMPDLPNWPNYDNLYGKTLGSVEESKAQRGNTQWQILYHFNSPQEVKMGSNPGPWTARLRDNLCRRGDFADRPNEKK